MDALYILMFLTACSCLNDDSISSVPPTCESDGCHNDVPNVGLIASIVQEYTHYPNSNALTNEAKNMSPNEIIHLMDTIDTDKDGFIGKDDLIKWLKTRGQKRIIEKIKTKFTADDTDNDHVISLDEFKANSPFEGQAESTLLSMFFMQSDTNQDGHLTLEEFAVLVNPFDDDHMTSHMVEAKLSSYDDNRDGYVDINEYVGVPTTGEVNSERVDKERREEYKIMDRNKDGRVDLEELGERLESQTQDNQFYNEEADLIMLKTDYNKDGVLSVEELLSQQTGHIHPQEL